MIEKNIRRFSFYILLALLTSLYIFGFHNISFTNTDWLASHDMTTELMSWKFFKNDIWRFPIGSNPNNGMDIGSGLVFGGSIPLFSIIFKIFKDFLPNNFHHFSLWIFLCIFLQAYISFLIIHIPYPNCYLSKFFHVVSIYLNVTHIYSSLLIILKVFNKTKCYQIQQTT